MRTPLAIVVIVLCNVISAHADSTPATQPASTTALPDLPHIVLTGTAIPPAQLFDEIAKDTGVSFVTDDPALWAANGRPQSIDVNIDQPFWPAVQQACVQCKVGVKQGDDGSIVLMQGGDDIWHNEPFVSTQAATFVINGIIKTSELKLYKPDAVRRRETLQIEAYIDPRLHAAASGLPLKIIEAKDNRGHDLQIIEPNNPGQQTRGWKSSFHAGFTAPPDADKITVFKAETTLIVDEKSEAWSIPDVLTFAPATRKFDGFDVTITKIAPIANGFEIALKSERGNADTKIFREFKSHLEDWIGRIRLTDSAGKEYRFRGGGSQSGDRQITMTRRFELLNGGNVTAPVKMVWLVPVATRPMPLTFEFKDLPLP